jgi:hypothetical protein
MRSLSRLSCHEPFSIQFAIDLTLHFGEHQNGESLGYVRENLCQSSKSVLVSCERRDANVFRLTRTPCHSFSLQRLSLWTDGEPILD